MAKLAGLISSYLQKEPPCCRDDHNNATRAPEGSSFKESLLSERKAFSVISSMSLDPALDTRPYSSEDENEKDLSEEDLSEEQAYYIINSCESFESGSLLECSGTAHSVCGDSQYSGSGGPGCQNPICD